MTYPALELVSLLANLAAVKVIHVDHRRTICFWRNYLSSLVATRRVVSSLARSMSDVRT